jgi:hypothetical protein
MPKAKPKTNAVTLAPDPALTALKTRVTNLVKASTRVPEITNTPSFETASTILTAAVALRKDLKALPVYVELAKAKTDIKAKEKLLKDVEHTITNVEQALRDALELYAARQREAQNRQIESALAKGKDERAASLAATPFVPPVQGLSFADHWHAEITDLMALVEAVARREIPLDAITPNFVYLNAKARDVKAEDIGIAGAKGVKETSSTVRT